MRTKLYPGAPEVNLSKKNIYSIFCWNVWGSLRKNAFYLHGSLNVWRRFAKDSPNAKGVFPVIYLNTEVLG
jgi:hypothetical protein